MISASPRRPMFVVSFYSYKGGVGRSVALMNTAQQLASGGRKVVMLDFDLEAPGLHSACNAVWPKAVKDNQRGFTDFFIKYLDSGREPPPIDDYISSPFGPDKRICLIPAGNLCRFDEYSKRLLRINETLLDHKTFARELLLKIREDLAQKGFDYLLIDSRTGHTDILGATTVLLPYLVVFVTNLSKQSLTGTRAVLKWVQTASDAAMKKVPPEAPDVSNRFFYRSVKDPAIQMLVIASPVPLGDHAELVRAESKEELGRTFDHVIYYVPQIATRESQHVAKTLEDDPVGQYRTLADKIRILNPFEPSTLVEYGFQNLERQDWIRALSYFDAAEHFLNSDAARESDKRLNLRRQYGEIRALALGFQTEKASQLLDQLENERIPEGLEGERLAANLQMVRGHLASNQLTQALKPALNALSQAKSLSEKRGRADAWEVVARLQLADVHCFLGEMEQAVAAVSEVPKQAEALNRAMERVKALQLLATAQAALAKFTPAQESLNKAVEIANNLGVTYLIAGSALAQSVIDLTQGRLSKENANLLKKASKQYADEGDGLSAADCLTELAIYRHRLGSSDPSAGIECLKEAFTLYGNIAGTKLGQVSVLLYAAEIQFDAGKVVSVGNISEIEDRFTVAWEALSDAHEIATVYKLPEDLHKDIEVWTALLQLFRGSHSGRNARNQRGHVSGQASSELVPRVLPRERNRALQAFLVEPSQENLKRLEHIAQEAQRQQLAYNEVIARTLVALGRARLDEQRLCDDQMERIKYLAQEGNLGWSIWGHVRNICNLRDKTEKWQQSASMLLTKAQSRGLQTEPPPARKS